MKPHITRTVEWSPHGIHFPRFRKYVMENDTLQGIEECKIMIRRERARRKRIKKPEEYRIVDELSDKPDSKGPISTKILKWMEEVNVKENAVTPEREASDADEEDGSSLVGKRVKIKVMTRRTKYNDKIMTIDDYEKEAGYFLVRHQHMTDVLVVKRKNVEILEDEDATRDLITGERKNVSDFMLEDGITRVVDGRHNRRTANGQWREVTKDFGDWFQKNIKKTGRNSVGNVEGNRDERSNQGRQSAKKNERDRGKEPRIDCRS